MNRVARKNHTRSCFTGPPSVTLLSYAYFSVFVGGRPAARRISYRLSLGCKWLFEYVKLAPGVKRFPPSFGIRLIAMPGESLSAEAPPVDTDASTTVSGFMM